MDVQGGGGGSLGGGRLGGSVLTGGPGGLLANSGERRLGVEQQLPQQQLPQQHHESINTTTTDISSDAAESKCDDNVAMHTGLGSGQGLGSGLGPQVNTSMDVAATSGEQASSAHHITHQQQQQQQQQQHTQLGGTIAPGPGLSIRFARGGLSPRLSTPPAFDMNISSSSLMTRSGKGGSTTGRHPHHPSTLPSYRDTVMMDVEINETSTAQGQGLGPHAAAQGQGLAPGLYSTGSCKLQAIQGLLARFAPPLTYTLDTLSHISYRIHTLSQTPSFTHNLSHTYSHTHPFLYSPSLSHSLFHIYILSPTLSRTPSLPPFLIPPSSPPLPPPPPLFCCLGSVGCGWWCVWRLTRSFWRSIAICAT